MFKFLYQFRNSEKVRSLNRGQSNDEQEKTVVVTEPSDVPLVPVVPDVQRPERVIRCSGRSNKGRTDRYGDYITGEDIEKL